MARPTAGPCIGLIENRFLRAVAALAAMAAGAIHILLGIVDLIPGEPTRGAVFALMGLGYLACAGGLMARRALWDGLVLLYGVGLILAYAFSRAELPIELIGLTTKTLELIVVVLAAVLLRRAESGSGSARRSV